MNFEEEAKAVVQEHLENIYRLGWTDATLKADDHSQLMDKAVALMNKQLTTLHNQAALDTALGAVGEDEIRPKLTMKLIEDGGGRQFESTPYRNELKAEIRANLRRHFKQEEGNDEL